MTNGQIAVGVFRAPCGRFEALADPAVMLTDLDALRLPAPKVGESFDSDRLPDAIRTFQSGGTSGKVVVTLPED